MSEQKLPIINTDAGPRTINLSFDDLQKLIVMAIKTAKEPDDETKLKNDEEKTRKASNLRQMIENAKITEENQKRSQARCGHRKGDGQSTVYGQIHSDGKIHPICVRCQKLFTAYAPPQELISGMGF